MKTETFERTISSYNQLSKIGKDLDFGKNEKYLNKIIKPQFYAVKLRPEILGTLDGVKVNENLQPINKNGETIRNLYVIGNDAGGIFPLDYCLKLNGASVGFAVFSGRHAATHAFKNH
ncbi:FAD-binding protein [Shewanella sp. CG12_big_fil_rev_8_21_14_0_65_47_15]|uniref:FAD-binding protein n=1 Tax=Shewanella sp. CG12_big_fil_rev_8_21_14_0_65_47_15 TaxID=1975537 RepID=UPI000CC2860F|nr:FAD-binding protein [Shewanella sp. CG12_big_fil_rev_8_21_14_0_65_47_15]PIW59484.1 MAG: hypothetical protein COW15_17795 [Shewanella sp. CG12_big_fil_rev_8_21_14_0_65_47_15]